MAILSQAVELHKSRQKVQRLDCEQQRNMQSTSAGQYSNHCIEDIVRHSLETRRVFINRIHNRLEIILHSLGGFCVIGDLAPVMSNSYEELVRHAKAMTRALIRTNLMDSIYNKEVRRTNRIGVSLTGVHEWAWKDFKLSFMQMLDEYGEAAEFWSTVSSLAQEIQTEAIRYSEELGLVAPHTALTIKPSGCLVGGTKIKTSEGIMSLLELFELNQIDVNSERGFYDPSRKTLVYDANNELKEVTSLFVNGVSDTFTIEMEDGLAVTCTPEHKFLISNDWKPAFMVESGEKIVRYSNGDRVETVVKSVTRNEKREPTFDIQVEDTHSYQLENGAVTHNTTSKWFGLSEGWHLPSMRQYLRWVSFRSDSEQVNEYRERGYPTRELRTYEGQTIVGFPTAPLLTQMMPEELIVTAGDATPEEQYEWLLLGEKYWLKAGGDGEMDNQISYTLKYKPEEVSFSDFADTIRMYQSQVKCCSVMPQEELVSYEYQPEEPVTKAKYEEIVHAIEKTRYEDISKEHIDCVGGACPVDFNEDSLK